MKVLIRTVAKSNYQAVECKVKLGWFHIAVAVGLKWLLLGSEIGYKYEIVVAV